MDGLGCFSDGDGGRVECVAKKKRALHSRFNRKTSFIRSFIIIKEPGKVPRALVPTWGERGDGQRKEKKNERNTERKGETYRGRRERKKE